VGKPQGQGLLNAAEIKAALAVKSIKYERFQALWLEIARQYLSLAFCRPALRKTQITDKG